MQRAAVVASACLVLAACGGSPSSPSALAVPNLMVQGEVTVSVTSGIMGLQAYLGGRDVGYRGGSEPWGSPRLTIEFGRHFVEAATVQPGTYELSVVLPQSPRPPAPNVYMTEPNSRVQIVNRDTGAVLTTAALPPQDVRLEVQQTIRWTLDIDSSGRVQVR